MDAFRELATAFLERERHRPHQPLIAELRDEVAKLLKNDAEAAEAWSSKLEALRRVVLERLFRTQPAFAATLAGRLDAIPGFPRGVAEDAWDAAAASNPVWSRLELLGLTRPVKGEDRRDYVRALSLKLLADPPLLAGVADALGSAVPFTRVLERELDEIAAARQVRDQAPVVAPPPGADPFQRADEMNLLGLALSGGGIRSATFNLGVLQALASLRLLRRFDLLSTVSGGGYVGGWLAAWIKRHPGGVRAVEASLRGDESWPVAFLRQYSNYLTPRAGFFSADTWTMVTTWVRNTLLNQAVLVLFLATLLLLPHFVLGAQVVWGHQVSPWVWFLLAAALLLLLSFLTGRQLRHFSGDGARGGTQAQVQRNIILTALVAGIFASGFLAGEVFRSGPGGPLERTVFLSFFVLFAVSLALTQLVGRFDRCFSPLTRLRWLGMVVLLLIVAAVCAALGAAIIWANIRLFTSNWFVRATGGTWGILVLGPMLLMQSYALAVTLQQGLLGREFSDERREWWSRAGAWVLIYSFGWAIVTALAMLVPYWLLYGAARLPFGDLARAVLALLWAAITGGGVLAAKRHDTDGTADEKTPARKPWLRWLPVIAPYVFIIGIAALLSLGVFFLLNRVFYPDIFEPEVQVRVTNLGQYWCLVYGETSCGGFTRESPKWARPLAALVAAGLGGLAAFFLAWRVDVNEFSMHHFYKNRLVRCYLGGSRGRGMRAPNRFTGFDPDDDIPLARMHLATRTPREPVAEEPYDGPYHIINTALNLVTGENLAWQERRAASFVFTPHHSGWEVNGAEGSSGSVASEGYRPTDRYAYPPSEHPGLAKVGGIHLGTALAISGAAANPNMGYHSSPAAAFLMTMFNVRLGWWMGNPRHRKTYRYSSPRYLGLSYLLKELTGNSDDRSGYINLSDGGHFDNLGLYELVRRRCRWIVVCDAEQDAELSFGGLGNAIRKCRADFGVDIDVRTTGIRSLDAEGRTVHCAVGTIHYPGAPGTLVYLKSSLSGDEQTDVLEYRRRQPGFPHQSTGDQWFDESQFESYRALGYHVATRVLGPKAVESWEPAAFFEHLKDRWHPPSTAVERHFTRHVEAYDQLMERLRSATVPASLDAALSPGLGADPPPFPQLAALLGQQAPVLTATDERTSFYLCNSLILLMERVFLDLDLEAEPDHPHNRRWIQLFGQWAGHPQFQATWAATREGYGAQFQRFVGELVRRHHGHGP